MERSPRVVHAALPKGTSRAATQAQWMEAVRTHPAFSRLRRDSFGTLMAIATQLSNAADWQSMTSRPTWHVLGERASRSRSTVAAYLALLREAKLVGVVATGRSAGYAPMALDERRAEAAVYVLAVPSPVSAVARPGGSSSVDEHRTPSPLPLGEGKNPLRVGARGSKPSNEPLRGQILEAEQARPTLLPTKRSGLLWPRFATAKRRDDRRVAASAIKRQLPVLRDLSDAKLASLLREYMQAGWTIADVVHALDTRPDGTLWPHSGAQGVRTPAAWLRFRLSAWRDEAGAVTRSRGQRADAALAHDRARHRAENERLVRDRANTVTVSALSPTVAEMLAAARAQSQANARAIRQPARGTA